MRILVTGSRDWTDVHLIIKALCESIHAKGLRPDDFPEVTVVHGGAKGADRIAGYYAQNVFMKEEYHPADWNQYGKSAGYVRNKHMVNLGADVCLAFIKNNSKGATMCAGLAEKAGIPVQYFREDSMEEKIVVKESHDTTEADSTEEKG